jgi:hypothetical protein
MPYQFITWKKVQSGIEERDKQLIGCGVGNNCDDGKYIWEIGQENASPSSMPIKDIRETAS